MNTVMKAAACLLSLAAVGAPSGASAQGYGQGYGEYTGPANSPSTRYCAALIDRYHTYVANQIDRGSRRRYTADVGTAVAQCQQGNPAGIPTLERALMDAGVGLPSHG